jgi:hypothetical protein
MTAGTAERLQHIAQSCCSTNGMLLEQPPQLREEPTTVKQMPPLTMPQVPQVGHLTINHSRASQRLLPVSVCSA